MDDLLPRARYTKCAHNFEKEICPKFGIQVTEKIKKEITTLFRCIDYIDQIKDDNIAPIRDIDRQLLMCLMNQNTSLPENLPANSKESLEELRKILHEKNKQKEFTNVLQDISLQEQKLSEAIKDKEYIEISKKLGQLYASLFNILFYDIFDEKIEKFMTNVMVRGTLRDNYEDLAEDHNSGRNNIETTQALKLKLFKSTFIQMIKIYKTYPDKRDARKRFFIYMGRMIKQI